MGLKRIAPNEWVPLLLCAASSLGILPFAVMRFLNGEWIIGFIDSLIVISMAALGIFVFRTHKVRSASIYLAVVVIGGALATVYIKGPLQVFWIYPAMIVTFYILKPKEALLLVMAAAVLIVPSLMGAMDLAVLASVIVTLMISNAVAYSFAEQNNKQQEQLRKLATRDPLTGVGNRRAMQDELDKVVALFRRNGIHATVLLLDLDRFKSINDNFGHATGDETLTCVARMVRSRIRETDGFYRIGGEEFVVVVHGQGLDEAAKLGEALRIQIENCREIDNVAITVSMGIAQLQPNETPNSWLNRADQALYRAKKTGRNRICLARDSHSSVPLSVVSG